jgi:Ca2+/Na+ antiporter
MAQPAYEYTAPPVAAPAPTARSWSPGLIVRIVLTLIGAAAMIVGAFLKWIHGLTGVQLDARALWRTDFLSTSTFVRTVGFVVIVLGLLAIVGLAPRSGWLTRLAGVLGIVAFVLFTIELYRTPGRPRGADRRVLRVAQGGHRPAADTDDRQLRGGSGPGAGSAQARGPTNGLAPLPRDLATCARSLRAMCPMRGHLPRSFTERGR